jgi:hypothetical protein
MKNILLSLCSFAMLCFSTTANAQTMNKIWDKDFGGFGHDFLEAALQTIDGGYIFGGTAEYSEGGDISESAFGNRDYWVIKTNEFGTKLWDKRFGGDSYDYLKSMILTSDGGCILAGFSYSEISGNKTTSSGNGDFWIIKIDGTGLVLWQKSYGGIENEELSSIVATPDGNFVLGGFTSSPISGDVSQPSMGNRDYWLIKIDPLGNKIWDKRYGGSEYDHLTSIINTVDGGFLIGGISNSNISGNKSQMSFGFNDFWVIKINDVGEMLWEKTFGGSENEALNGLLVASDGGYIIYGDSNSGISGNKSQNNFGSKDYWIVKADDSGLQVWDKGFGSEIFESLNSVLPSGDGGYLLGGKLYSDDYHIKKINRFGSIIWDRKLGGDDYDNLKKIIPTRDGGYLLAGSSMSMVSGDKTEPIKFNLDFWVIKTTGYNDASVSYDAPSSFCLANTFNIPFITSGSYFGNIFTAQLSDINGGFSNPINLGSLTSNSAGTILAQIPNGTPFGNGYKIRIVSTSPAIINNPTKDFSVTALCPPPCPTLLLLSSSNSPTDDVSSGVILKEVNGLTGIITANNKLTGTSKVTYRAGTSITLESGFKADNGVIFKTEFGGCSN